MADLTRVAEVLAEALYEAQRASVPADDPMIAVVGVPWRQAPRAIRDEWVKTCAPLARALADAGLVASETECETQFAARAGAASSVRLVASAVGVYRRNGWDIYQREVRRSPWRPADEGGEA